MTAACPVDQVLSDYLLGELDRAGLDTVASHVDTCRHCVERLSHLHESLSDSGWRGLAAASPAVRVGTRLRDYELLDVLGQGGMGTVYRARHVRLDKIVAVKVIRSGPWSVASAVARFEREMKAVGRVRDPRIVQATDAGDADGVPFIAMEFVDGVTLAAWVKANGPTDARTARSLVREAAIALQHAHDAGIVHRDVKPGNLMRAADGSLKLLDLGLAMLREEPEIVADGDTATGLPGDLTSPSRMIGTRDYMAPEQRQDAHAVDARADVYGLGGVLWFLLSAQPPRVGPMPAGIPETVWRKLLAENPAERYPTATDVATALAEPPRQRRWILATATLLLAILVGVWWFAKEPPIAPAGPPMSGKLGMTPEDAVGLQQVWAKYLDREPLVADAAGRRWALVPPGTLTLDGQFEVTITKPFDLATTETTVGEFRAFVEATGYRTTAETAGGTFVDFDAPKGQKFKSGVGYQWRTPGAGNCHDHDPVSQISPDDAVAYCAWLTQTTGLRHRLPTEAEWLWAYRAGQGGEPGAAWGKPVPARLRTTAGKPYTPCSVGQYAANPWGLHDMIGNVAELCEDFYAEYPKDAARDYCHREPTEQGRVIHGHAYYGMTHELIYSRGAVSRPDAGTGFRVLREIPAAP